MKKKDRIRKKQNLQRRKNHEKGYAKYIDWHGRWSFYGIAAYMESQRENPLSDLF